LNTLQTYDELNLKHHMLQLGKEEVSLWLPTAKILPPDADQ
jgi:hypothetical protein